MTEAQKTPQLPYNEFIDLAGIPRTERTTAAWNKLAGLAQREDVVAYLAPHYWRAIRMMETAGEELKKRLQEDPTYIAARTLFFDFGDFAVVPVRNMLLRRYKLNTQGLRDSTVITAFFALFGSFMEEPSK